MTRLKRPYRPFRETLIAPDVDPFAGPLSFICLNSAWLPYILGALPALADPALWEGSSVQVETAINRVQTLIASFMDGGGCPVITDLRLTGCVLEVKIDGSWVTVGDVSGCGAQGPTGATGATGAQGPAGSAASASEVQIAQQTLGAQAASITFSSIPQTYHALRLRCLLRTTYAGTLDACQIRFNGDTGNNYKFEFGAATNAVASATGGTATGIPIAYLPGATAPAAEYGMPVIDVPYYYGNGVYKHVSCLSELGGQNAVAMFGGEWLNGAPITSITVLPSNSPYFVAGSQIYLMGVKV